MFINCILFLICALLIIIASFYYVNSNNDSEDNLPPGPRYIPIFGHLLFMGSNPPRTFMKWSKIYGPILSLKFGSIPVVVLNDLKLIKEILSLPALTGRPSIKNWEEMTESKGVILVDGPRQVEQRNFAIKTLGEFGIGKTQQDNQLQEEIRKFLDHFKKELKIDKQTSPKIIKIHDLFQTPAINSILSTVFGERFAVGDLTTEHSLKFVKTFLTKLDNNSGIIVQLTHWFSWLASILSYFGVNSSVNTYHNIKKFATERIQASRADYVPGQPKHFTHAYFDKIAGTIDHHSSFHVSGNDQEATTTDIFIAATKVPTTSMDWLLLHMAREPEIQKKLQMEIDTVVGKYTPNNTPSLSDRSKMPYTQAVIQELLRISSALPLGIFRRATEDIQVHGYKIPKGTMVIANQFGVNHDPKIWPEPDRFLPERFLNDGDDIREEQMNLESNIIAFGYGKRTCVGQGIARNLLFLFCASFFQRFSIECTGNIPQLDGNFGITFFPNAFEVVISER